MTDDTESLLQPDATTAELVEEKTEPEAVAESTEPAETAITPDSSPEKKDGVQKRIDELTKARRAEERARIAAENEAQYWRDKAQKPEPIPEPLKLKTLEDFNYNEQEHLAYLDKELRKNATEAAKLQIQEDERRRSNEQKKAKFVAREDDFSSETDDYHDTIRATDFPLSKTMLDVALEMENGPAVLYYLGKNKDIARSLYNLSPLNAAIELGKIEAKVSVKKGPAVSNAPPPTPKIKATDASPQKKPEEMNDAEFAKWRRGVKERLRKG